MSLRQYQERIKVNESKVKSCKKTEDPLPNSQEGWRGYCTKATLSVFRSNTDIYVQLIDDDNGVTLASASSKDKDIAAQKGN